VYLFPVLQIHIHFIFPGPFTFFSPDRLAFERLGDDYHKFRNDTKAMEAFIKFHTVRHVYTYEELHVNELSLWTLLPERIRVNHYYKGDVSVLIIVLIMLGYFYSNVWLYEDIAFVSVLDYGLWYLSPLSTIVQSYSGGQFYCWGKPEIATDLPQVVSVW
jgi:hypothetical protein